MPMPTAVSASAVGSIPCTRDVGADGPCASSSSSPRSSELHFRSPAITSGGSAPESAKPASNDEKSPIFYANLPDFEKSRGGFFYHPGEVQSAPPCFHTKMPSIKTEPGSPIRQTTLSNNLNRPIPTKNTIFACKCFIKAHRASKSTNFPHVSILCFPPPNNRDFRTIHGPIDRVPNDYPPWRP